MEDEIYALGILLFNNELIFSTKLIEEDFTSETRKKGFTTLVDLVENGEKVDCLYLSDKLNSKEPNKWYTTYGTGSLLESHERRIREATKRRKLNKVFTYQNSKEPTDEIVNKISNVISNFDSGETTYRHVSEGTQEVLEHIEETHALQGKCSGLRTGLDAIDYGMSGLHPELIIIGARPSVGKTSLVLTIVEEVSKHVNTGIFSLEMRQKLLTTRFVCMKSNVGLTDIRRGMLKPADFESMARAMSEIEKMKLFIHDEPAIKYNDLKANIRRMVKKDKVKIVFIDYIGLISPEDPRLPRHEQVSQISKGLKALQMELNISIVVLTQVSRSSEEKRPTLASIRESGSIEQDADTVIFLHRDNEKYNEAKRNNDNLIQMEFIIAKQRNGPVGIEEIEFAQKQTRFQNPIGGYND